MPDPPSGLDAERRLRRLRLDWREELEEAEAAVEELAAATRTMREALLDLARTGAVLRLELGTDQVAGRIGHVGDEVVGVVAPSGGRRDVAIGVIDVVRVDEPGDGAALVTTGHPGSLAARLRECSGTATTVRIDRGAAGALVGRVRAVAATHVELVDGAGRPVLVRLGTIRWAEVAED